MPCECCIHGLHHGFHPDPKVMEWLRLAGIILIALAALMALVALFMMIPQSPDGVPLMMTRR